MAEAGLYSDYFEKGLRRPGDPHLRVKDMDRDGVDAEVIYGILAACAKAKDPEAADEMLRIYNDFMHDFSSHYPDRMIGLACLPYSNIEGAAREVRRVAKMGMKGVELSCSWHMTADVASVLGSPLGGGQRDAAAAAFPHLPGDRSRAAQVVGADDLPPHDL